VEFIVRHPEPNLFFELETQVALGARGGDGSSAGLSSLELLDQGGRTRRWFGAARVCRNDFGGVGMWKTRRMSSSRTGF